MDIAFKTRHTPNDKVREQSNYRCPECRDEMPIGQTGQVAASQS
jgi:hypothetical protein